jgi:hypothetical protein
LKILTGAILVELIVLVLMDQMRLQPWVYIYFSVFVCLVYAKDNPRVFINGLQVICIGIYLWSGIHKFNENFLDITFKSIFEKFVVISNKDHFKTLRYLGYGIPVLEVISAVLLYFRSTRTIGVVLILSMHIFILIFVGFLSTNRNYIIIPWNVAMMVIVVVAFLNTDQKISFAHTTKKLNFLALILTLFFWIAPSLNFFSKWDSYLSFSLYSDKVSAYYVAIEERELPKIDKRLTHFFVEAPTLKGGKLIDMYSWSMAELNVPFYPEDRVFRKISESFCKLGINNDKLIFLKIRKYPKPEEYISFKCY